ncbi:hypothetical protein MTO96_036363 [Rhipicephalus appendiculatus]
MAAALSVPMSPQLPAEVWCIIALYLDADSQLAFQDSEVAGVNFLQIKGMTRKVTLSPHSDARVLETFLDRIQVHSVNSLRIRNCFLACPDRLLQTISRLTSLVKLDCVNCPFRTNRLFTHLSRSLPALTKLCWSIYCDSADNANLEEGAARRYLPASRLQDMYVEISGDFSVHHILIAVIEQCSSLKLLHVHAISENLHLVNDTFAKLVNLPEQLTGFTFTSQYNSELADWSANLIAPQEDNFRITASILGNVAYRMAPDPTCTCVYLEQISRSEILPVPQDPLILLIEDNDSASARLLSVAQRSWWDSYRSLTIASLAATRTGTKLRCRLPRSNSLRRPNAEFTCCLHQPG